MIEIIDYQSQHQPAFAALNLAWISKDFAVEPHDEEQLGNPQKYILDDGGQIFLAKIEDEIVGTIALVKMDNETAELAKMSVTPTHQGKGISRKLCERLIEVAKSEGYSRLYLESNRKAVPAINLYLTLGFVELPMKNTPYARCDIQMEMKL